MLRIKVEKIKSQQSNGLDKLLGAMAVGYNKDLDNCCLVSLGRIAELLRGDSETLELRKMIFNFDRKLEPMLNEKSYASTLGEEIAQLSKIQS